MFISNLGQKRSFLLFCLGTAVISLSLAIVILAAVPPVSKDALVHHLAVPKLYLKAGSMYEIPSMPYSYYPMNLQLLYLVALSLGSDIASKFIHFAFAVMTSLALFGYLSRRISRVWGLLGALLFLSVPIVIKLSIIAYVDLVVVFFVFGALLSILAWMQSSFKVRYLLVSAVLCGLALGTKYNALIALFILTSLVPLIYIRKTKASRSRSLKAIGCGLLFFSVSLLVFSPWMIRNYSWTGNPIHPLYQHWFQGSGKGLDGAVSGGAGPREVNYGVFTYRRVVYGESGWEIALLPVRIFFEGRDGDPRYFDGKLHPFLLLLPLFAFLRPRRDLVDLHRQEKFLLLTFSILFFALAFFSQGLRVRYIAPIIPPLVILSVFGLRNIVLWIRGTPSRWLRISAAVSSGAVMLIFVAYSVDYLIEQFRYVQPLSYLSGKVDREAYITRYRPEYPVIKYANQNLSQEAKILLVFMGRRGYYLDRDYVPGVDRLGKLFLDSDSPEEALRALRQDSISHLLVYIPILDRWAGDNLGGERQEIMRRFFKDHTRSLCFHQGYALHALVR
ncbi:MAG: ArnT family glycosyltransferase [Thermodesulfobacteriota bacterium]